MNTAVLVARLALCAAAIEAGQPWRCLPLLLDLIEKLRAADLPETHELVGHARDVRSICEPETLDDECEPYIWDQPYMGEPPRCRLFE